MVVKTETYIRSTATLGLKRGIVQELGEDGLVSVVDSAGYVSSCEQIESESLNQSPLRLGDRVLFLPSENDDSFGCVVGRIGINRPIEPKVETFDSAQSRKIESDQIEIHANSNLLLKCGQGSISIKQDGTIVIKGTRLLSRSSGVNKVKGASVQIN